MTLSLWRGTALPFTITATLAGLPVELRACDTMGELGWGKSVEFGPGKHSLGHSYYVYLLDPDGHRVELLLPPIVYMDGDDPPVVWDVQTVKNHRVAWGLPPRASWFTHRSRFLDCEVTHPTAASARSSRSRSTSATPICPGQLIKESDHGSRSLS